MLGDNSTHSMVMIPKCAELVLVQWLKAMDDFDASDGGQMPHDDTLPCLVLTNTRWQECTNGSVFFADFSPELQKLLWWSRDARGWFNKDAVNVVRGLLGDH